MIPALMAEASAANILTGSLLHIASLLEDSIIKAEEAEQMRREAHARFAAAGQSLDKDMAALRAKRDAQFDALPKTRPGTTPVAPPAAPAQPGGGNPS